MAKQHAAVKFFLKGNKVVVLTLLTKPNPKKLKILANPAPIVTLPGGASRPVIKARGRLVDAGVAGAKWLLAMLEYDTDHPVTSRERWLGPSAGLEITITNDPDEIPITVEDPQPAPGDGPPLDGDIDLMA